MLLPTDTPDELGFRIMWYNPVPPIDKESYRLEVGGMVEKPLVLAVSDLRAYPAGGAVLPLEMRAVLVGEDDVGRLPFRGARRGREAAGGRDRRAH